MKEPSRSDISILDTPTFTVEQLSYRYGTESTLMRSDCIAWVLREMTFTVQRGEIVGVVGPNGSGKSTLLRALARLLLPPHQGKISLCGSDLASWSREEIARHIAYMPQEHTTDFPFTVLETVLMGRFPYRRAGAWDLIGWESKDDLIAVEDAMAQTDVEHLAGRAMAALSAGERQRVLLARALAQEPRVLLLDEPTAYLDLNHQLDVCRILRDVHARSRMTVLLVSHDLTLASQYCDRILVMRQGEVVCYGVPREVITTARLTDVYGCEVLVDAHPETGLPRVTLPAYARNRGTVNSAAEKTGMFRT